MAGLPEVSIDTAAKVIALVTEQLNRENKTEAKWDQESIVQLANKTTELTRLISKTAESRVTVKQPLSAQDIHVSFGLWARQQREFDFILAMERAEEAAVES